MKFLLGIILSVSLLGMVFKKTTFNRHNAKLKDLYTQNDTAFIGLLGITQSLVDTGAYGEYFAANQYTFVSSNLDPQKQTEWRILDSLLSQFSNASPPLIKSTFENETGILEYAKRYKSYTVNFPEQIPDSVLGQLKPIIDHFKQALIDDPANSTARHNFETLQKKYLASDFYSRKSKEMKHLVFEQLRSKNMDVLQEMKSTFKSILPMAHNSTIEFIKTDQKKKQCQNEIADSLNQTITDQYLKPIINDQVDSLKSLSTLDNEFIKELLDGASAKDIIDEFYKKDFKKLYGESQDATAKKVIRDPETNLMIEKIIFKYLDKKTQEQQKEKKEQEQKKQQEQKEKKQEQKQSKEKKEEQKESDQPKDEKQKSDQNDKKEKEQKEGQKKDDQQGQQDKKEGQQNQNDQAQKGDEQSAEKQDKKGNKGQDKKEQTPDPQSSKDNGRTKEGANKNDSSEKQEGKPSEKPSKPTEADEKAVEQALKDYKKKAEQEQNNLSKQKKEMEQQLQEYNQKKANTPKSQAQKHNEQQQKALEEQLQEKNKNAQKNEGQEKNSAAKNQQAIEKRLEKYNMSKENADQTLKAIQQKGDKYLQGKKRAGEVDADYSGKPDW